MTRRHRPPDPLVPSAPSQPSSPAVTVVIRQSAVFPVARWLEGPGRLRPSFGGLDRPTRDRLGSRFRFGFRQLRARCGFSRAGVPAFRWVSLVLLGLGLAGLTGCGGSADPESAVPANTETRSFTTTVSPVPSSVTPSPSRPVPAADDPQWSAHQLAAVHALDTYYQIKKELWMNPANADFGQLAQVATDPQYSFDVQTILHMAAIDKHTVGGITAVSRVVSAETSVDGRPEIHVRQCQEDDPGAAVVEQGSTRPVIGNSREEWDHTLQWLDQRQAWFVADAVLTQDQC